MTSLGTYGYGAVAQPRRSGMTTAGKWMFIIGLVLSLISAAALAWGVADAVSRMKELAGQERTLASGNGAVAMQSGETRFVITEAGADTACSVVAPDGSDVALDANLPTGSEGQFDSTTTLLGQITADQTGDYVLSCSAPVAVTPPLAFEDMRGALTAGIAGLALVPLGLLTLLGLVLWLVGRGRDRKAALSPTSTSTGGYAYGYPSPGPTQPYGQTPPPPGAQPYGEATSSGAHAQQPYGQHGTAAQTPPPPPTGWSQPRSDGDESTR